MTKPVMRSSRHILVAGNGSLAGYLLGVLSGKAKREGCIRVTAIVTEHSAAVLRRQGLRVDANEGTLQCWPNVLVDPRDVSDVDIVVLAARTELASIILQRLKTIAARGATIVVIANGVPWWLPAASGVLGGAPIKTIDPNGALLSSIPVTHLVAGIADITCDRPEPGRVRHYQGRTLTIGSAMPDAIWPTDVQQSLTDPWLDCTVEPDIRTMLWSKLIDAGSINPVHVLTGAAPVDIATSELAQSISILAIREIETVGLALGLGPFGDLKKRLVSHREAGAAKTSLLQEIERGLDLELDATIGAIIEVGHRIGIRTPTLRAMQEIACLKAASFLRASHTDAL
jgi:2-dehydropantoate 2-reductase